MPNNWTDKLETFSALVLQDAQERRDELMESVEKEYSERLDKKETELLEGAYNSIQKNIRTAEKSANEKILHAELDAKKKLILKREQIIGEVMSAVRDKLTDFTKSDEYEQWLIDKTKKAFSELGEGEKNVYLSAEDMRFAGKIKELADSVTVEETKERGTIGGVTVTNTAKHIAADYSLGELLSEQKTKFLRESGLTLD